MRGGEKLNAIGMLFHQVQSPNRLSDDREGLKDNLSAFHVLLVKEQTEADNEISGDEEQHADEEMIDHGELLYHLLMGSEEIEGIEEMQQDELTKDETLKKLLNHLIAETDNNAIELDSRLLVHIQENLNELEDPAIQKEFAVLCQKAESILSEVLNEQDAKQLARKLATLLEKWTNNPLSEDLQVDLVTLKGSGGEQHLAELLEKVEKLLTQISTEKDAMKIAPKLLTLLEQWTVLEKKYSNENNIMDSQTIRNESSTKEHSAWRALLDVYQKRQQFVTQQHYNSDAKVTSTDVAKWIHKALNENTVVDKPSGNHISFANLSMSKVEQYVIHVNQTHPQGSYSADEQLMEQLKKVMKASRFSTMPNGTSQLSINLRPNNLGEIMVRLTQVNGEMTVKIIVTSHATKEMLQSNIHQLKNMFSPQQVFIERQELNTDLNQELNEEQEKQSMKDQGQNQSEHSEQHKRSKDDDLETKFHDLLLNEKV